MWNPKEGMNTVRLPSTAIFFLTCKHRNDGMFPRLLMDRLLWLCLYHLQWQISIRSSGRVGGQNHEIYVIGGSKGGARDARPPRGSKFFHFHAVFGKNVKNNSNFGSWRPPPGKILNPPLYVAAFGSFVPPDPLMKIEDFRGVRQPIISQKLHKNEKMKKMDQDWDMHL